MTKKNEIDTLKKLAKRHARANRIAQHESLNAIASELGFAHWAQLGIRPVSGRFQAFSGRQFHGMSSSMRLIL
jgi:hypothetical protein